MALFFMRLEYLRSANPRRPGLFTGFTGRGSRRCFRLGRWRRHHGRLFGIPLGRFRFAVALRRDGVGVAVASASAARAPPVRSQGARLLGGRELLSGP